MHRATNHRWQKSIELLSRLCLRVKTHANPMGSRRRVRPRERQSFGAILPGACEGTKYPYSSSAAEDASSPPTQWVKSRPLPLTTEVHRKAAHEAQCLRELLFYIQLRRARALHCAPQTGTGLCRLALAQSSTRAHVSAD